MGTTQTLYVPDKALANGLIPDAPETVRRALREHGIDGWTETSGHGYWQGQREDVTLFSILNSGYPDHVLASMLRDIMPAEDAVLVTSGPVNVTFA